MQSPENEDVGGRGIKDNEVGGSGVKTDVGGSGLKVEKVGLTITSADPTKNGTAEILDPETNNKPVEVGPRTFTVTVKRRTFPGPVGGVGGGG